MRIAMTVDGPTADHVRALAMALSEQGHDITVYSGQTDAGPASVVGTGFRTVPVERPPRRGRQGDGRSTHAHASALVSAWRTDPPSVVHSHGGLAGLATVLAARTAAVPVLHSVHSHSHSHQEPDGATVDHDVADLVAERVTGLFVHPHQPRALVRATRRLLADPILREQYGAVARDRACARYSWPRIALDTLHAYLSAGAEDPNQLAHAAAVALRRGDRTALANHA